jgi:hypothetical protein
MSLLAKLTGRWNFIWQKVANICATRQPENLYYQYVAYDSSPELLHKVEEYLQDFSESDEWCWCWMHKDENGKLKACGPELLMLKSLIKTY